MQQQILTQIVEAIIADSSVQTKRDLQKITNQVSAEWRLSSPPPLFQLLSEYKRGIRAGIYPSETRLLKLFRKRAVRSLSGVSVISLLTKFWGCPGKCVYCPTFENLPKSYVPQEPAVMRAELNEFDPVRQIQNRLRSLEVTGHTIVKCDIRVIGGTWSVYPVEYQEMIMRAIHDGHTMYQNLREHIEAGELGDRLSGFRVQK